MCRTVIPVAACDDAGMTKHPTAAKNSNDLKVERQNQFDCKMILISPVLFLNIVGSNPAFGPLEKENRY